MANKHITGEWIAQHFMNESSIYCPAQREGIAKLRYRDFNYSEDTAMANAEHIVKCVNEHDALVRQLQNVTVTLKFAMSRSLPTGLKDVLSDQLNSVEEILNTIKESKQAIIG